MNIAFSRRLALIGGVLLPLLETIHRWDEIPGPLRTWNSWLDDYVIGGFLLLAAWRSWRDPTGGRPLLAAAWGVAIGMGWYSLMGQMQRLLDPASEADPSGLPHIYMIAIKAGLLALGITGLIGAVQHPPHQPS